MTHEIYCIVFAELTTEKNAFSVPNTVVAAAVVAAGAVVADVEDAHSGVLDAIRVVLHST